MSSPFPGYPRLIGPETLIYKKSDGTIFEVKNALDYRHWHQMVVTSKQGETWASPEGVVAYVNFGRWVVDCHWCKKGILTRPDWAFAGCAECGAYYEADKLTFPSDPRIEELLRKRPDRDSQHWDSKQTADDLLRENEEELHL
jgi:hypothetical protein